MEKLTGIEMLNKHFPTNKCLSCPFYLKGPSVCEAVDLHDQDGNIMIVCLEKQLVNK